MLRISVLSMILSALIGCSSKPPENSGGATATSTSAGSSGGSSAGSGSTGGSTTGSSAGSGGTSGGTTTGGSSGGRGFLATVSTLAGNGVQGFKDGSGGEHGTAQFGGPNGVAVDDAGNVYVADTVGHRIRKIAPDGAVTTVAGNGTPGFQDGSGGPGGTTSFGYPSGIVFDPQGFLLVSDDGVNRIRKVALPDGATTTFAGNGSAGFVDGTGGPSGTAEFNFNDYQSLGFSGLCSDGHGTTFVVDPTNNAIRAVAANGSVTTLAGNGTRGATNGPGGRTGAAEFNSPGACAVDPSGNVYVADFGNNRIRKIDSMHNVTTLAGNGVAAHLDGTGGPNGTAEIFHPAGVAYDPTSGTLFAPDTFADYVRHIAADGSTTTLAGDGTGWRDGPGYQAQFNAPAGMIVDPQGRLIVAEFFGYDIRVLTFH